MIELHDVSYRYHTSSDHAVQHVSFTVSPGECVALIGLNGSGKSTLARLLNASRVPESGRIVVDGIEVSSSEQVRYEIAKRVGLVRQDPRDQLVASRVFEEVSFGPCNLGLPQDEVKRRSMRVLKVCDLQNKMYVNCDELSGGEQQRLAIADMLAMEPSYLVFDEVTAFLDIGARQDIVQLIGKLKASGHGVVVVSHELQDMIYADKLCLLEAGKLTWQGSLVDALLSSDVLVRAGLDTDPLAEELAKLVGSGGVPQDVASLWQEEQWRACTKRSSDTPSVSPELPACVAASEPGLKLTDVSLSYNNMPALAKLCIEAEPGCITLLAGASGAGKSSALRVMAGALPADTGTATLAGKTVELGMVGLALQNPEEQLFCASGYEEVAFAPANQGLKETELDQTVRSSMTRFHIEDLAQASPFALSGGQARRVALASVVSMKADAYVFDEPTAGLDGTGTRDLQVLLTQLAADGAAVVVVSHDICLWLGCAHKVYLMEAGHIVWHGAPQALQSSREAFEAAFSQSNMAAPLPLLLKWRREGAVHENLADESAEHSSVEQGSAVYEGAELENTEQRER